MATFNIRDWLSVHDLRGELVEQFEKQGYHTVDKLTALTETELQRIGVHKSLIKQFLWSTQRLAKQGIEELATDQLNSRLYKACQRGNLDEVKELVAKGANINWHRPNQDHSYTPLHRTTDIHVVRYLCSNGANYNDNLNTFRYTPVHMAALKGCTEVVKFLYESGASVDTDSCKGTPLHAAALYGHTDTVRYLAGLPEVDVNATNIQGDTALHHAASFASLEMIKLLVAAGAKPLGNKIKLTPLHMVVMNFTDRAQSEVPSCINHLVLEGGADINAVSLDGNTALHFAADRNRRDYAVALLRLGAEIKTINGVSPIDAGMKYDNYTSEYIAEVQNERNSPPKKHDWSGLKISLLLALTVSVAVLAVKLSS